MIHDIIIEPLKEITDDRGKVMHMLRSDSPIFENFGEIYFAVINPNAVKAWKLHREMTLNLAVPFGKIKLVVYDDREDSPTRGHVQELIIGENNYNLVKIPPKLWNGFQGLSKTISIIANCATLPHDPKEVNRLAPSNDYIPYEWKVEHCRPIRY